MIFTNCGLLGDMFLCLPVLSWYYKTHTEKVTFAQRNLGVMYEDGKGVPQDDVF